MAPLATRQQPTLTRIENGLSSREAVAILVGERRNDSSEKVFRGILIVAILGLLILLIPDRVEFSFEFGKLKFDKLVGQKELLCLLTTLMLYRFAADLSKFAHYSRLYEYRLDVDFGDEGKGFVRHVSDDIPILQYQHTSTEDKWAWWWLDRINFAKKLLIYLIVFGSVGAAFVITAINIGKLFWSPTIGGVASYVLLSVSTLLVFSFLTTLWEAVILTLAPFKVKERRDVKEDDTSTN